MNDILLSISHYENGLLTEEELRKILWEAQIIARSNLKITNKVIWAVKEVLNAE